MNENFLQEITSSRRQNSNVCRHKPARQMLYHTFRSLSCSSHSMMKVMIVFFLFFFSFWKWSFSLWQSANLAKSCLALHNLLLRDRTWLAKALQSFSSCSDHQSVMYNVFPWSYKNILIGVGSLNENASVHILLGMYARPQKMNPLHLFLSIICDRSSSEWQMASFCSHPSQCTSSSHKEHECCKQEQRWERKRKKQKSAQAGLTPVCQSREEMLGLH